MEITNDLTQHLYLAAEPHLTYAKLLKCLHNDPDLRLKHDSFSGTNFLSFDRGKTFLIFNQNVLSSLFVYIDSKGFENYITKNQITDAVNHLAILNSFDEPSELIKSLIPKWDGKPRIESFYLDIWGMEDNPQNRADGNYLWTGAAGRHLEHEKGCRIEIMPTWVSDEGINKSTLIRECALKPEWYKPITFNGNESDISRKTKGGTFMEFSEIEGMEKKGEEFFKFWFPQTHDYYRPLYQENFINVNRRWMMIATSNKFEILQRGTNRRFNIKHLEHQANIDLFIKDKEQYFAEGAIKYMQSGVMWQDTQSLAKDFNKNFEISSSVSEKVAEWLHIESKEPDNHYKTSRPIDRKTLTILEILEGIGIPVERQTHKCRLEVGQILKQFGFKNEPIRINGILKKIWLKK